MYMLVGVLVEVVQARHVPSCSIMFHHVPSCSIMFHHVPSCSINFSMNCSQLQSHRPLGAHEFIEFIKHFKASRQAAKLRMWIVYGDTDALLYYLFYQIIFSRMSEIVQPWSESPYPYIHLPCNSCIDRFVVRLWLQSRRKAWLQGHQERLIGNLERCNIFSCI